MANADARWNTQGDTMDFSICLNPCQAIWFRELCLVSIACALFAVHLFRLRQLTRLARERLQERHQERESIAQRLNDDLLQSVQGLVLHFQVATEQVSPDSPVRVMLEGALNRSDDVLVEARDRVRDLRAMASATQSLSEALAMAGEELAHGKSIDVRFITDGTRRSLKPMVRAEAYRIGREALDNALVHAQASSIEVEINYDPDFLRVRVRDDGVGLEKSLLNSESTPDHRGLVGMYERAESMGARLDIWARQGLGTEVSLSVPATVSYDFAERSYPSWFRKWVGGVR